jgi:hypothetical protein
MFAVLPAPPAPEAEDRPEPAEMKLPTTDDERMRRVR